MYFFLYFCTFSHWYTECNVLMTFRWDSRNYMDSISQRSWIETQLTWKCCAQSYRFLDTVSSYCMGTSTICLWIYKCISRILAHWDWSQVTKIPIAICILILLLCKRTKMNEIKERLTDYTVSSYHRVSLLIFFTKDISWTFCKKKHKRKQSI